MSAAQHLPVLLAQAIERLAPQRGGLFVDCTVGLGGHAEALLERAPQARLLGFDRDPQALRRSAERLRRFGARVRLRQGDFGDLGALLESEGESKAAGILADLGVSSLQLDAAERGFSFRREGPLDMRMGPGGLTAGEIVNSYAEADLERILREYGEERDARRIARTIVAARLARPLHTTAALRELIVRVKGSRQAEGRVDPATRAFQALRIEVNQELVALRRLMEEALRRLETDGRPRSETRLIEVLTRKPVRPDEEEIALNPRARSARLRAARRL